MTTPSIARRHASLRKKLEAVAGQIAQLHRLGTIDANLEAQHDLLCEEIVSLERELLTRPARSLNDIATKLRIIADRGRIGLDTVQLIQRLARQIREWRLYEAILFDCP
jgi:hypothetical protein